jgi:hypothetical protein
MFDNCSEHEKEMYTTAYNAINKLEKWEFLKTYEPPKERGFMWDTNPLIEEIMTAINNEYGGGHSGSSLAITMRKMKQVAKNMN